MVRYHSKQQCKAKCCTMIKKPIVYFLLVSTVIPTILTQGSIGDVCYVKTTQAQGICKLSSDCPLVEELAKRGVSPSLCNNLPTIIVCCENTQNNVYAQPNENSFLHNKDNNDGIVFPESESIDPQPPAPDRIRQSVSEEKCAEYGKLVTGSISAAALIPDVEHGIISVNIEKCDSSSVPLIVGGTPASAGEFPFMAAIGYNNTEDNNIEWNCGGTLISERYVVTAAHCASTKFYGPPVKVRLGDLDLKRDDDSAIYVDYDIAHIKVHEQYRPPARYNDIALLRLSRRVSFTKYIRPACLWSKQSFETNKTIATGWGQTGIAEEQSSKLLKVALDVYDNSVCKNSYPPNPRWLPDGIRDTMLCAGELKGGKDTCQGDSGGPLVVTSKKNRCIYYIVGITSFGRGCGGQLPAVYTRISEYVSWVEQIIW